MSMVEGFGSTGIEPTQAEERSTFNIVDSPAEEFHVEPTQEEINVNSVGLAADDEEANVHPTQEEIVLFVGKKFQSIEEVEECYTKYASSKGFSIKKRGTERKGSRVLEFDNVRFSCICEGAPRKKDLEHKEVSSMRSGCKARMRMKRLKLAQGWGVTVFDDSHNHPLISPSKMSLMKSRTVFSSAAKALTEAFAKEQIQINKVPQFFGGPANCPFNSRKCYNHLRNIRAEYNDCGDAQSVRVYFEQVRMKDTNFYYAIDVDECGKAVNFFWIDGKSRLAYKQFGDVVTFDTTYNTNRYKMPFGPFTGVNHHGQSILFGCCLIENETEDTFVWVFKQWLMAMDEKHPVSIITDQDPAMNKAIAEVFPNTRHRFCLWHIKKKFPSNLSHLYVKNSDFKKEVKHCLHQTHTIEEFEEKWAALISKHDLQEHKWLTGMYEIRHKWMPIFCVGTFFAGMTTTQRSESMNSFFDIFVTKNTNLRQFVEQYHKALETIYVRERKEDFDSIYKHIIPESGVGLLVHAAHMYTRNIYKKFSHEFKEGYKHRAKEKESDGVRSTYGVGYNEKDAYEFTVQMNMQTNEGSCSCKYFEFQGIPCRHLCHVFHRLYLTEIPPYFMLARWGKYANRVKVGDQTQSFSEQTSSLGDEAMRVCHMFKDISQSIYLAGPSQHLCNIFLKRSKELFEELIGEDKKLLSVENGDADSTQEAGCPRVEVEGLLLDPHISQTKGRKRANPTTTTEDRGKGQVDNANEVSPANSSVRIKSSIEKATTRKKGRVCKMCLGVDVGHDSRNCPKNPKMLSQASGGR